MKKMSFSAIQGVLSRDEMKSIMAGSEDGGGGWTYTCKCNNEAGLTFECSGDCFGAAWYMCGSSGATCTIS